MTDESYGENEERMQPGVERIYHNDQIAVSWKPKLCIHAGNCFRGLPEVFKPQSRPWISVDAGTADKIAEVVMTCRPGRCTSSGWMMALKSLRLRKQPSRHGPMARYTSGVGCGLRGPAAGSSGKIHASRYAGVATLRTSPFVMGVIAELGFTPRNCLRVR